jgi:hypothetical protein
LLAPTGVFVSCWKVSVALHAHPSEIMRGDVLEVTGKQTILNAEGYNLCVFTAFRGINSIVLISSAELFTFA